MWRRKWAVAISFFGLGLLTTPFALEDSSCTSKVTCGSCIQTSGCAWCSKPEELDSPASEIRCRHFDTDHAESGRGERSADSQEWCPPEFLKMPQSEMSVIEDKPLKKASKKGEKDATDAVQIRPQKVKLRLRVNESFPLELHYAQAEDYPVDLYYLMDLSASMADDKDKLSHLGDKLAEAMNKLTGNFRLGFGSFVDKREMPFVSTVPAKLKHPCTVPGTTEKCASPYVFKNHMPLSLDTARFKAEVNKAPVSGNLDSPEGGLDALMQVLVCNKEIGWREKARRMIILSTDATFHLAGDGKLAGIVEPNDGLCHLKNNTYTHGEILDYPSISQINLKAKEKNTIVIFAVNKKHNELYKNLASVITGASSGELNNDSSNVVELVQNQYGKLVKSVALTDDAESHIEVRYYSSCLNESSQERETKECGGIRVQDKVKFKAMIRVLRCPEDKRNRSLSFRINPVGLSEVVEVELEIICDCDCEISGNDGYEDDSPHCTRNGKFQCGVCICNDGFVGNKCECDATKIYGIKSDDVSGCRPEGNVSAPICNNMGECKCGVCICVKRPEPEQIVSGKYCECDNYSCKRSGKMLCSGPDQGICKCGECECNKGWTGETCNCRSSNDTCIKPGFSSGESVEICSGHGKCSCGKCYCNTDGETRYSGKYCEVCPTCTGRCKELGPCVECQVFGSSTSTALSEEECNKCGFNITVVETLSGDKLSDDYGESDDTGEIDGIVNEEENAGNVKHCSLPDHTDCIFFFDYSYDNDNNLIVIAKKQKQCAPPVDVLGVVLSVIGSIVLAGLVLLLIWKLLTNMHDHREFVRFEKERQMAKWDKGENPLYQKATTSFANPTFGK